MMAFYGPVDPECSMVATYRETLFGDPLCRAIGAPLGEMLKAFERHHRTTCVRCQEYGMANIDVEVL